MRSSERSPFTRSSRRAASCFIGRPSFSPSRLVRQPATSRLRPSASASTWGSSCVARRSRRFGSPIDLATEALGRGFNLGVVLCGALIAAIAIAYYLGANAVLTFWLAYILTRPLGASLGDLLSQAPSHGGLGSGHRDTNRR